MQITRYIALPCILSLTVIISGCRERISEISSTNVSEITIDFDLDSSVESSCVSQTGKYFSLITKDKLVIYNKKQRIKVISKTDNTTVLKSKFISDKYIVFASKEKEGFPEKYNIEVMDINSGTTVYRKRLSSVNNQDWWFRVAEDKIYYQSAEHSTYPIFEYDPAQNKESELTFGGWLSPYDSKNHNFYIYHPTDASHAVYNTINRKYQPIKQDNRKVKFYKIYPGGHNNFAIQERSTDRSEVFKHVKIEQNIIVYSKPNSNLGPIDIHQSEPTAGDFRTTGTGMFLGKNNAVEILGYTNGNSKILLEKDGFELKEFRMISESLLLAVFKKSQSDNISWNFQVLNLWGKMELDKTHKVLNGNFFYSSNKNGTLIIGHTNKISIYKI